MLIEAVLPPALSPCFSLPSLTAMLALQKSDPRKTFPDLKDDMLGNLKRLKKTMSAMDWQVSAGALLPIPSGVSPAGTWCAGCSLGSGPLCIHPLLPPPQDFETWMHKWLLFEMAKGPKMEEQNTIPAEKGMGVWVLEVRAEHLGAAYPRGSDTAVPCPGLWLLRASSSLSLPLEAFGSSHVPKFKAPVPTLFVTITLKRDRYPWLSLR